MNPAAIFNPQPQQIGSILFGADEFVARFVANRIGSEIARFDGRYAALGVVRWGVFVGGAVYFNYAPMRHGNSCEVAIAFDDPRWALPATLRGLCNYPFKQLDCVRVTAIVAKSNKRCRRWVEGFGFSREGVHPKAYDGKQTAISYGLLREDCKFLRTE